tara:strand:- start:778 stop:1518 length:741 start_codon:yes stop_codon:yes gene_type:complete
MLLRIVKLNIKASRFLANKYPFFFIGNKHKFKDLKRIIKSSISKQDNFKILEIGGIDRPILKKSKNYEYSGLDIDSKESCYKVYDKFIVQSIEEEVNKKFSMIISSACMEHVRDNKKSFLNIYNALENGGSTHHYIPSKNHFYSLILRLVGPFLQRKLIKYFRPQASLEITGYPAFFDLCSYRELKKYLKQIGFIDIKIIPYYKATDYFAFFTPLYIIIAFLENIIEFFNLKFFAAGLVLSAKKAC